MEPADDAVSGLDDLRSGAYPPSQSEEQAAAPAKTAAQTATQVVPTPSPPADAPASAKSAKPAKPAKSAKPPAKPVKRDYYRPYPWDVRDMREDAGLTQAQAADIVCVSPRTWQRWEMYGDESRRSDMSAGHWKLFIQEIDKRPV